MERTAATGPACAFLTTAALAALLVLAGGLSGCIDRQPRRTDQVRSRLVAETAREKAEAAGASGKESGEDGAAEAAETGEDDIFGTGVEELDLHAVLLYALEHSPRIRAARYGVLAAEARQRAAGWLPDPRFSWGHNFEELQTRNGPVKDVFSLTQTFPFYKKLTLESDAADALASAENEASIATELGVLRDVQRAYFAIYLTGREIAINDATRGILTRFVRVAQRKVAAGKGGQPDILLAEIELSRLENERIDLEQRLVTEKVLLNTLLDREPSAHLPPVAAPDPRYDAQVDSLVAWMLDNLPDVRRYRDIVEANRAALRLARLRYVPDLTLGVTYTNVGGSPVAAGTVDDGKDGFGMTVGINLPLWLPKYSAETEAAARTLDATRSTLADVELLSVYKVMELHVRVETALRRVKLIGNEILPKAVQTVNVLETGYEAGTVDFLKLLDAERTVERFKLEHERTRTDFEQRFADLERAVGKPLRKETRS